MLHRGSEFQKGMGMVQGVWCWGMKASQYKGEELCYIDAQNSKSDGDGARGMVLGDEKRNNRKQKQLHTLDNPAPTIPSI